MNHSRRKFFGTLAGVAAGAGVSHGLNRGEDFCFYRGYKVTWTGWKPIPNQAIVVGQWLAVSPDPNLETFYSSTTGSLGGMRRGYVMDISHYHWSRWIHDYSPKPEKDLAQKEARERLIGLIDAELAGTRNAYLANVIVTGRGDANL